MCKVGDIIVIENCERDSKKIGRHSFVVLSTDEGEIEGMSFDLLCNIMCSFDGKGNDYKKKKLSYPENMAYSANQENILHGHNKDGFIKAGIYFLFNRADIDYKVIGNIQTELYLKLINYIESMNPNDIKYVSDNLRGE